MHMESNPHELCKIWIIDEPGDEPREYWSGENLLFAYDEAARASKIWYSGEGTPWTDSGEKRITSLWLERENGDIRWAVGEKAEELKAIGGRISNAGLVA